MVQIISRAERGQPVLLDASATATVYDAACLELAVRPHAPVASVDRALNAAARFEGADIV